MTDIVKRLLQLAERERPYGSLPDTLEEGAAEIERLRADLRLAVMSDRDECKALSQEVERLVKSRNRWGQKYNALLDKHKRLRAALEMFACDCMDGGTPCSKPENCRNYIARAALETREAGVSAKPLEGK